MGPSLMRSSIVSLGARLGVDGVVHRDGYGNTQYSGRGEMGRQIEVRRT